MKKTTIKVLKAIFVLSTLIFIAAALLGLFGSDEQRAEEKLKIEAEAVEVQAVATDKPAPINETPLSRLVADNEPDPTIGGKSRMEAFVECQVAIQKQLSNPRSFDVKTREVVHKKYEDGGEHLVGFKFYAKNQFNAESEHMAVCAFDGNGKRLTAEYK